METNKHEDIDTDPFYSLDLSEESFYNREELQVEIEEDMDEVPYSTDDVSYRMTKPHVEISRVITAVDLERFRIIGDQIRILKNQGRSIKEIMNTMNFQKPSTLRRLEMVMEWLENAGLDPGAAILSRLSKNVFLNVISRGITNIETLEQALPRLSILPAFDSTAIQQIELLIQSYQKDIYMYQ